MYETSEDEESTHHNKYEHIFHVTPVSTVKTKLIFQLPLPNDINRMVNDILSGSKTVRFIPYLYSNKYKEREKTILACPPAWYHAAGYREFVKSTTTVLCKVCMQLCDQPAHNNFICAESDFVCAYCERRNKSRLSLKSNAWMCLPKEEKKKYEQRALDNRKICTRYEKMHISIRSFIYGTDGVSEHSFANIIYQHYLTKRKALDY